MSEHRGRRQLWTAALIVAPGAAAVFSTAMAWAVDAVPETATPTSAPQSSAAAPTNLTALKHSVDADAQRVKQLQQTLAILRGQLVHATPQAGVTASLSASSASAAGGDTSTGASRAGAPAAPAATPAVSAPIPPQAPTTNRAAPAPTPSAAPTPSTAPTAAPPAPSTAPPPVHTSTGAS